jgi:hypothetical protein
MLRMTKHSVPVVVVVTFITFALGAPPAAANMQEKTVVHEDETFTESGICPFNLRTHVYGSFKVVDYFDNSGFLYKEIATPGGGSPFTVSYTAHGTTLTQRNNAYSTVVTFNPDGSAKTFTQRGAVAKFTVPGVGIVLHETGTGRWSEPDETLIFLSGGPHQAVNGDFDEFCAAFG